LKIEIKPLSVNECFQGRRFKTPKYKAYEKEALLLLKPMSIGKGQLSLSLLIGLSSKNADLDNILKPWIDIMQKKYGFNDRHIYKLTVEKVDVKKGFEFIEFHIEELFSH
jgi:Holliday junction resolvase RusA-like endonuclease